jgi:L-ascorbate metabolism protein UlaG (beta-lactamase superfamily)
MNHYDTAGPTVHITVEGGVVQHVAVPLGVRVVVRDYDVDGSETDLAEDENGDKYNEGIWE